MIESSYVECLFMGSEINDLSEDTFIRRIIKPAFAKLRKETGKVDRNARIRLCLFIKELSAVEVNIVQADMEAKQDAAVMVNG